MAEQNGIELSEAAEALGTSIEALRKKLQRGHIQGYKVDGRWYVVLPHKNRLSRTVQDNDRTRPDDVQSETSLIESLKSEVEFLRSELATRTEEARRKDHIIAALSQRIPQLPEAPQEDIIEKMKQEMAVTLEIRDRQFESRLEERDRKLMETLRSIQEQKIEESNKKRSWFRWRK